MSREPHAAPTPLRVLHVTGGRAFSDRLCHGMSTVAMAHVFVRRGWPDSGARATAAGEVALVMVSRIDPATGHAELLRALVIIGASRRGRCWIVGGAQSEAEEAALVEHPEAPC